MAGLETPRISTYTSNTTAYTGLGESLSNATAFGQQLYDPTCGGTTDVWEGIRTAAAQQPRRQVMFHQAIERKEEQKMADKAKRRVVKVVIADPDERVPVDQALLYNGEEKFTDATDQELFFEIDIKALLDKHNTARAAIKDKKVKEREEFLEPIKIRDLRMVVVNVAEF